MGWGVLIVGAAILWGAAVFALILMRTGEPPPTARCRCGHPLGDHAETVAGVNCLGQPDCPCTLFRRRIFG